MIEIRKNNDIWPPICVSGVLQAAKCAYAYPIKSRVSEVRKMNGLKKIVQLLVFSVYNRSAELKNSDKIVIGSCLNFPYNRNNILARQTERKLAIV
ncbi:hypothetical protein AML91_22340 [Paenibacillus jilunlii]|uniref:Uncharacterized protein n=1 Tax=Paenibacillus jilunlii TaxID=682956 RepID=A0ABR5SPL0_9BACL|nr:hypothetical protein AML91_22340 [Paenibacillus jilunlii]